MSLWNSVTVISIKFICLHVGKLMKMRRVLAKIHLLCPCCIIKQPQDSTPVVSVSVSDGQFDMTLTETELSPYVPKSA